MRPLRAATLSWEVTRARPARSRGSRCAMRATWPRWLVPNCSSNPSAVVCRSGGVMTPALLIRMWIGRPSSRRVAPSAAIEAREDRSSSRSDTAAPGVCSRIARDRGLALARVADGQDDLGAGGGEPAGDPEPDAVAGAGDDGALAGEVGDGDVGGAGHGCSWGEVFGLGRDRAAGSGDGGQATAGRWS